MSKQLGNGNIEDVSAAFDLLRDAQRRGVLYTVKRNGQTTVREIARRIAAWQSSEGGDATPKEVETSLVHSHLPKLADAGVVEYDREDGTVELSAHTNDLEPFLQCTREREPSLFHAARTSNIDRVGEISQ